VITNARYAVEKKSEYADSRFIKEIEVRLFAADDGGHLVFEVSDNGIGMPADVIQRCMEPFYTTKGVGEGTGLGLSIVHGIVKEFGLDIQIASQVEQGSTFRLRLPIAGAA